MGNDGGHLVAWDPGGLDRSNRILPRWNLDGDVVPYSILAAIPELEIRNARVPILTTFPGIVRARDDPLLANELHFHLEDELHIPAALLASTPSIDEKERQRLGASCHPTRFVHGL
jgi:hypothetical protein